MKLTFDVESIHMVHKPTIVDGDIGSLVAPAGGIVIHMADGDRMAMSRERFERLFPQFHFDPDLGEYVERNDFSIPDDATPIATDADAEMDVDENASLEDGAPEKAFTDAPGRLVSNDARDEDQRDFGDEDR